MIREKNVVLFEPRKPKDRSNLVRIFVDNELVEETSNVVVYSGREFAAQKVADVVVNAPYDLRNYKITHFGIGTGGVESGTLSNLVGPLDDDTTIYKGIQLASSNTQYLSYVDSQGNTIQYGAKPITLDGSIEIIQDPLTGKYTTVKYTLVVESNAEIPVASVYVFDVESEEDS